MEKENIQFYDSIAEEYKALDSQEPSNTIVREKVKDRFLDTVQGTAVLDFGGGTGLDLEWLSQRFTKVYFCEPSEKMRAQAIRFNAEKLKGNPVVFLNNNQSDFQTWTVSNPFIEKL